MWTIRWLEGVLLEGFKRAFEELVAIVAYAVELLFVGWYEVHEALNNHFSHNGTRVRCIDHEKGSLGQNHVSSGNVLGGKSSPALAWRGFQLERRIRREMKFKVCYNCKWKAYSEVRKTYGEPSLRKES